MSDDRADIETRASLERLARDPVAASEWEEMRRIEDALEPRCGTDSLHAGIMARIAADGPAPWMTRTTGKRPARRGAPMWALAAAILLVVVVAGVEYRSSRRNADSQREAMASLSSLAPIRIDLPGGVLDAARPARLGAEGRQLARFAESVVQSAASPLRALPARPEPQPGGDSSMIERERSS